MSATGLFRSITLVCLLVIGGLADAAKADEETVQIEVVGHGSDRQDATFDALAEAVRQVHGVEIRSRQTLTRSSQELAMTDADGARTSLRLSADQSGTITAGTAGYISSYRVLSAAPRDPGFVVRLRVDLPVYRGPGMRTSETRRNLAVYPFDAEPGLRLFGERVDSARAARHLTQAVIRSTTQTRRFAVLERERTQAIIEERRLLSDPAVSAGEKARLGATLGADYVMIGRVVGLDIDARERVSGLTGESRMSADGSIVLDLRILSPATRQVHWADTVTIPADAVSADSGSATGRAAFEQALWTHAADRVTERAISAIYPLRLIDFEGEQLVINQGGSQLHDGMMLQVFALGEELFDPYTGESLGRRESPVARARIERVTDRVSYARIVEGVVRESDPAAYLARRVELSESAGRVNAESVRGTRRGTWLPQDR